MNFDKEIDTCGLNLAAAFAFARQTGNELVSSTAEGEQFIFRMRRR